ncbi:MAG: hypothetical protein IPP01_04925 [Saprospiraceae bacterium]|nr:hypothetical protein [Saprospiraceae bacterium]
MKKDELLLHIIEEFEMKILRNRILSKKLERDIDILNNFYTVKQNSNIAPHVKTVIKKRELMHFDAQTIICETQQNKFYYQKLLKNE